MSDWLEHSEQVEVSISAHTAYDLWADIQQMPQWMNWIESVTISEEDPEISRWKLASGNFEFAWQARTFKKIPGQIIQWESVDGLPNRGAIRFYDRKEQGCVVRMSIAYKVPGLLALMDDLFLGRLVEANIRGDLNRFRELTQPS
ncbi:MAG: SRPBCC family protein [Thermosynechococcaceae cyanobacterium]